MIIKVIDHIDTAFSIEDAECLERQFIDYVEKEDVIVLDFEGIEYFTTLFFNNAISKYVLLLSKDVYDKRFKIIGLSEVGETTYNHSLENAIEYSSMSEQERKIKDEIVLETQDE